MQLSTFALALAAACALPSPNVASTPQAPSKDALAPPSLVLVPGGRTKIGTPHKELIALIEEHKEAEEKAGGFLSEWPEISVKVEDYYMMVSEVTNEQFRAYVEASGAKPPYTWGEAALAVARAEHAEKQKEARDKAKAEGRQAPAREALDEAYWWDQNWKDSEWEVPQADLKKPVTYIDYQDARGYAEWAGLRLPTEFEFERAIRGDDGRMFPWGDEWKKGMAATKGNVRASGALEVGSFEKGVSEQGLHDLVGNVWEWTQSPFNPYKGWKQKPFKIGKGDKKKTIDNQPKWSPDWRVVKSGSQQTGWIFARAMVRGGFDRYQRAHVLGFRCAASTKPGLDFAQQQLGRIPRNIRPRDTNGPVMFDPNQVIAIDRWIAEDSASKVAGYSIIKQYDYILFTPAEELQTNGLNDIRKLPQTDELAFIGFLATNQDVVEPALAAGTYLVAVRGAAKIAKRDDDQEGDEEGEAVEAGATESGEDGPSKYALDTVLSFDPTVDNYVFFDMSGVPIAAMPTESLEYGNPAPGGNTVTVADRAVTIEVEGDKGKMEKIEVSQQWLDIQMFVKGKSRKGLKATLSLRFTDGLLEGDWRR